jgi:hypothetical protein
MKSRLDPVRTEPEYVSVISQGRVRRNSTYRERLAF